MAVIVAYVTLKYPREEVRRGTVITICTVGSRGRVMWDRFPTCRWNVITAKTTSTLPGQQIGSVEIESERTMNHRLPRSYQVDIKVHQDGLKLVLPILSGEIAAARFGQRQNESRESYAKPSQAGGPG